MENRILGKSVAILHRREQKYMTKTMKEYGIGYSSYNFCFIYPQIQAAARRKCVKIWQWMKHLL